MGARASFVYQDSADTGRRVFITLVGVFAALTVMFEMMRSSDVLPKTTWLPALTGVIAAVLIPQDPLLHLNQTDSASTTREIIHIQFTLTIKPSVHGDL